MTLKISDSFDVRVEPVVLAVLRVNNGYVMQLRDQKPDIVAPGLWGLFGGQIEVDELPEIAIVREISEELCVQLNDFCYLGFFERDGLDIGIPLVHFFLFEADISDQWGKHRLQEGQAVQVFTYKELTGLKMPNVIRDILRTYESGNYSKQKNVNL